MVNVLFESYKIEERSYVSYVKREIHNLVRPHFSESRTGEIDIVVAEMASNLIKHAGSGELLYRLGSEDDERIFELICIDNGKGISDVGHAMTDGVSSKNTLGQGIGAITRLSNFSQIYSQPGWGTVVYSKLCGSQAIIHDRKNVVVRCLNVALPGEKVSGDGVSVRTIKDKTLIFCGDGLGHGIHAKEAVDKAIGIFKTTVSDDPTHIIKEIHEGVKKTRGLVGTVAVIDHEQKQVEICGVGNISTRLHKGLEYKNYISNNGVIGLNIPTRLENYSYQMNKLQSLILCSDGIRTKWDLVHYLSILKFDPMIIAAVIYKDHARRTDDMTVLIVKLS